MSFSRCILSRKVLGLLALPADATGQVHPCQLSPGLCLPLQTSPSEGARAPTPVLLGCSCFTMDTAGGGRCSLHHPPWNTLPVRCSYLLFPPFSECLREDLGFTTVLAVFRAGRMKSLITPDPILRLPSAAEGTLSVLFLPSHTSQEGWPLPRRRFGILGSFVLPAPA